MPTTDDEAFYKYQWACNGDESNVNKYGRLYTWHVVTDLRNICPTGWHVPNNDEWTNLDNYLNNNRYSYDGSTLFRTIALSLAADEDWKSDTITPCSVGYHDPARHNTTGFKALPAGNRDGSGEFFSFGSYAFWWSTNEDVNEA